MSSEAILARTIESLLRLKTHIVAFRRLEKAEELDKIPDVHRFKHLFTFCQLPTMARVNGWTVAATSQDVKDGYLLDRCSRIHGLREASEKSMAAEASSLATTWFSSVEDAKKQQEEYPRIPAGEAIVLAPLASVQFEPEVVMIYGNPAQIMMIMCGLQKDKYERFQFFFIGEGACADSLAQCYISGKPALAIPCYGERSFGAVTDDELVIALPPKELERLVTGLKKLTDIDLGYPIRRRGAEADLLDAIFGRYPDAKQAILKRRAGAQNLAGFQH